jgi:hypothetical protein
LARRVQQAHSGNRAGIDQIPLDTDPEDEQLGPPLRRYRKVFGVLDGQLLAIRQMQLEGPEWCSVAHFLDVEDFHARGCRLVRSGPIFNLHLGSAGWQKMRIAAFIVGPLTLVFPVGERRNARPTEVGKELVQIPEEQEKEERKPAHVPKLEM